jgi:hypothetical protein
MNALATMGMRILGGLLVAAFLTTGMVKAQQIVEPDDPNDLADLPLVFNVDTEDIDWEGYTLFPFAGAGLDRIENPDKSGINTTDYVIQYGKYGGDPWAGFFYHLEEPVPVHEESVFRLKVWSPRAGINAMLKLEMRQFPDVNTGDMFTPITLANGWSQLEWDLSGIDDEAPFDRVVIIMDLQGTSGDGSPGFIWYLDDFRFESRTANSNEGQDELAQQFVLEQNYPNPFNPTTNISFTLGQGGHASLEIYDLLGQKVATLVDGTLPAGHHVTSFTATDLPSGIYIYRLQAGQEVRSRTLTLIK